MQAFDVIVIGAGIVGSGAAYHLSKNGQRVLLLEQFEIDHQRGSSYGDSRIIRYAYDKTPYISLIKDVFPLWETLEQESGESLLVKTGGIDFGFPDAETFMDTLHSMQTMDIPHELLITEDARLRFPQFSFED
ncbi:MAG: FAD-dependent oxidoreductase, partial [Aggregatilineales bacterium]